MSQAYLSPLATESLADGFTSALWRGVFADSGRSATLRPFLVNPLRYDAPPRSARFADAVGAYRQAVTYGLLHTPRPVCIEDDSSAVFMRNIGPKRVAVARYAYAGDDRSLLTGNLELIAEEDLLLRFLVTDFYAGIADGSSIRLAEPQWQEIAQDQFVISFQKAFEQVAELYAQGRR